MMKRNFVYYGWVVLILFIQVGTNAWGQIPQIFYDIGDKVDPTGPGGPLYRHPSSGSSLNDPQLEHRRQRTIVIPDQPVDYTLQIENGENEKIWIALAHYDQPSNTMQTIGWYGVEPGARSVTFRLDGNYTWIHVGTTGAKQQWAPRSSMPNYPNGMTRVFNIRGENKVFGFLNGLDQHHVLRIQTPRGCRVN